MSRKVLLAVRLQLKDVKLCKKTLKEIPGYKTSYPVIVGDCPESIVELEVVFTNLDARQRKSLDVAFARRGWTVIETLSEKQTRISPRTKKILRNSAIYFGMTYVPSLSGITIVSPHMGITIEFIQTMFLSVIPASSAFLTRLAVELRIE